MRNSSSARRAVLSVVALLVVGLAVKIAVSRHNSRMVVRDVFTVDAPKLWKDYEENPVLAEQSYRGKWFWTRGNVVRIHRNFEGRVAVWLRGARESTSVDAHIRRSDTDSVARISVNDPVAVFCLGAGQLMTSPVLRECKLTLQTED